MSWLIDSLLLARTGPIRSPRWWVRHPVKSAFILLLIVLIVLDRKNQTGWLGDDLTRYHNRICQVVNVVDGDTIDIDIPDGRYTHSRIRMWGVDTPEVAKSGRGEMYFGQPASDFTNQQLLDRRVRIELPAKRTRDRYGRLLAYIYIDTTNELFNLKLIEQGYGYADHRFEHPMMNHFLQSELQAQQDRIGLWEKVTPDQLPKWKK